jgi:DNA-binding MarR family transcriptional regulator
VAADLPLPTLLSQALVAFTIEFDNEFERRMPHRTTNHGSSASPGAPWLVSLVMWSNCMRLIGKEGVPVRQLEDLAHTTTNLNGMERWGYIVVEPDPADSRSRPPRSDWVIRATPAGRRAQDVWRPLVGEIEKRWEARFGNDEIDQLRDSLSALVSRIDVDLPDGLPILRYGLFSSGPDRNQRTAGRRADGIDRRPPLSALLSRLLLLFAIEFERESDVSLAISANLVRVLDEKGVGVRDLPLLTGVSKEAIRTALGVLQKKGATVVGPDKPGSLAKAVRLTPEGREARRAARQRIGIIEARWRTRFGQDAIRALRDSLEALAGEPGVHPSPLFRGLEPYPDGWRASARRPRTLPHYPMVLHRGGFPDGS